jgi:hypothetical protein
MHGFALQRIGVPTRMVNAVALHHIHGGSSGPTPGYVRRGVYAGRWLFTALALRGWRRAVALILGIPRTAAESVRTRSPEPAFGYVRGLGRLGRAARRI